MENKYLSVRQVADILGVSKMSIYRWSKYKILPFTRLGIGRGKLFFSSQDIDNYIQSGRGKPPKKTFKSPW